jgi:hypothetical protein
MGMFRVFLGNGRRNFSAIKTCWRRECDSNSHYRFEFRDHTRFVIANHSPKMFAKTDLCSAAREKARENIFPLSSTGFLWSGFPENDRKIRAMSLDSSVTR